MVIIRTAGSLDAAEIARLNFLFNGHEEPAGDYEARLLNGHGVDTPILAENDLGVIGIANLRLLQPLFYPEIYAELTELYVEEGFRQQGVGKALIEFAERLALEKGAHELIILTDFYNQKAQSLYRSMGYQNRDVALSKKLVED